LRQNPANRNSSLLEDIMRRLLTGLLLALATPAAANDDIVLRGMGSFHVGGRIAEVKGKEVRMIVRQPGVLRAVLKQMADEARAA